MADLRIRAEVLDISNDSKPVFIDVNVNLCTITSEGIIDGHKDFWPWRDPKKSWNSFCNQVWSKDISES